MTTRIFVLPQTLRDNCENSRDNPPFVILTEDGTRTHTHGFEVNGYVRGVTNIYDPPIKGVKAWIETEAYVVPIIR